MKNAIKHLPILEKFPEHIELWESIYRKRRKKVGSHKAVYSANAGTRAALLKVFLEDVEGENSG